MFRFCRHWKICTFYLVKVHAFNNNAKNACPSTFFLQFLWKFTHFFLKFFLRWLIPSKWLILEIWKVLHNFKGGFLLVCMGKMEQRKMIVLWLVWYSFLEPEVVKKKALPLWLRDSLEKLEKEKKKKEEKTKEKEARLLPSAKEISGYQHGDEELSADESPKDSPKRKGRVRLKDLLFNLDPMAHSLFHSNDLSVFFWEIWRFSPVYRESYYRFYWFFCILGELSPNTFQWKCVFLMFISNKTWVVGHFENYPLENWNEVWIQVTTAFVLCALHFLLPRNFAITFCK